VGGCQGDFLGLLPGRETFVIDKKGKVVLAFNNQARSLLTSLPAPTGLKQMTPTACFTGMRSCKYGLW
jgi:hypothetical protein